MERKLSVLTSVTCRAGSRDLEIAPRGGGDGSRVCTLRRCALDRACGAEGRHVGWWPLCGQHGVFTGLSLGASVLICKRVTVPAWLVRSATPATCLAHARRALGLAPAHGKQDAAFDGVTATVQPRGTAVPSGGFPLITGFPSGAGRKAKCLTSGPGDLVLAWR